MHYITRCSVYTYNDTYVNPSVSLSLHKRTYHYNPDVDKLYFLFLNTLYIYFILDIYNVHCAFIKLDIY